jgi:hypothetical protein
MLDCKDQNSLNKNKRHRKVKTFSLTIIEIGNSVFGAHSLGEKISRK